VRHAKPQARAHRHNSDSRKGHESVATTQIYIHADLAIKEKALARTAPLDVQAGRYQPPDALVAFLESL
jgi:integrase/recombinase XerD